MIKIIIIFFYYLIFNIMSYTYGGGGNDNSGLIIGIVVGVLLLLIIVGGGYYYMNTVAININVPSVGGSETKTNTKTDDKSNTKTDAKTDAKTDTKTPDAKTDTKTGSKTPDKAPDNFNPDDKETINKGPVVVDMGDGTAYKENANYKRLGCFKDRYPNRVLPARTEFTPFNYTKCYEFAKTNNYKYFGRQNTTECWAGDDDKYDVMGADTTCNYLGGKGGSVNEVMINNNYVKY